MPGSFNVSFNGFDCREHIFSWWKKVCNLNRPCISIVLWTGFNLPPLSHSGASSVCARKLTIISHSYIYNLFSYLLSILEQINSKFHHECTHLYRVRVLRSCYITNRSSYVRYGITQHWYLFSYIICTSSFYSSSVSSRFWRCFINNPHNNNRLVTRNVLNIYTP